MHDLWNLSFPFWHFIVRAGIVYVAILILLRLGGKRQVGQMGAGEFVAILLISNAVQNSMNGGDNSVTGGLILAVVIIILSLLTAYLTYKSKKVEHLVQGTPTLLIHNGEVIEASLRREMMSVHELRVVLREQGIDDFSEVHAAIMESSGHISVAKVSEAQPTGHEPTSA